MEKRKYGEVKKLADQLGMNRVYLSAILRGSQIPSVDLAERISDVSGIPFFDLRPDLKKLMKAHL